VAAADGLWLPPPGSGRGLLQRCRRTPAGRLMGGFLPPAERRSGVLLGLYATIALLLMLTGDRIPQAGLRGAGAWLFAPFDRVVLVVDRVGAAWRENERLHERITRLELETARLRLAGVENLRLRDSLGLPAYRALMLRPAEVLALAGEPVPTSATLSAGAVQGVRVGDAVVTSDGLVGRIGEVYAGLSRVILLTDPNSAVACEVESTGVQGVLRSFTSPRPQLLLTGVPIADTVRLGQLVLTSGLSLRYPRGLPVGRVQRLARELNGLTHEIEIAPAASRSRLRHAYVVPGPVLPDARAAEAGR
jgi:rod shape-determining protein MreC